MENQTSNCSLFLGNAELTTVSVLLEPTRLRDCILSACVNTPKTEPVKLISVHYSTVRVLTPILEVLGFCLVLCWENGNVEQWNVELSIALSFQIASKRLCGIYKRSIDSWKENYCLTMRVVITNFLPGS